MQVAQRGDRHATAGLLEEESMIQLQLQEARRSLQMARDAAEALRLALGAQKLDDDMPEVMEHQRLAAQETELVRALESTRDRRAAICEGRVASALKIIEEHDRRFAKYIARGPEDEWQDHGNWLTYHVPNRAMRQLSVNSQGPAEIECQPDPFTSKPLAKDIEMALAGHIAQPCEGPGAGAKRECDNNAPGSPKKRLAFAPPGTAEGKNPLELSSAPHAPLICPLSGGSAGAGPSGAWSAREAAAGGPTPVVPQPQMAQAPGDSCPICMQVVPRGQALSASGGRAIAEPMAPRPRIAKCDFIDAHEVHSPAPPRYTRIFIVKTDGVHLDLP
jgi:hypothetical protein